MTILELFTKICDGFKNVYFSPLVTLILGVLLLIVAVQDFKYLKIKNVIIITLLIIRIIFAIVPSLNMPLSLNSFEGAIFGLLILLIPAMIIMKPMGGDIKLITVLGLYYGLYGIFGLIALSCVVALIFHFIIFLSDRIKSLKNKNTLEVIKKNEINEQNIKIKFNPMRIVYYLIGSINNIITINNNENLEDSKVGIKKEQEKKIKKGLPFGPDFFIIYLVTYIIYLWF